MDKGTGLFTIEDNKDFLLVYIFQSFGEKKEILRKTGKFENPFSFEEFPFHAKNVLIVLKPAKAIETREDMEKVGSKINLIRAEPLPYMHNSDKDLGRFLDIIYPPWSSRFRLGRELY